MTALLEAPRGRRVAGPGEGHRRLVLAVALATFLQWAGASAVLPMLPLKLRGEGASDPLVGAVMGAFYLAGVLCQFPSGRLADRLGRRRVLLAGLLAYGASSLGFLLPLGPLAAVALRAVQGAGAGAAEVAGLALVAAAVPVERRGQAFGQVYGAMVGGLALGPLAGSLAGVAGLRLVFAGAAATSLAACLPLLFVSEAAGAPQAMRPEGRPGRLPAGLRGAVVAALAIGLTTGVYESCWTLLLHLRHAAAWQVGLSWTLFAVPFVVMAKPAGWLADHLDRRWLAVGALGSSVAFCATYPFVPSVAAILPLGVAEAVGASLALPAVQSLLTEQVAPARAGWAQGLFATSQTAATGVAAVAGGALFALGPFVPFTATALVAGSAVGLLPWLWAEVGGTVRCPAPTRSALEVPHGLGQGLKLAAPVGRRLEGADHELGEAHR